MNNKVLKKLQRVEFEMLKELDSYLVRNNINYSLYAGTALGAVRHKGFIPWDDDIDIIMTRLEFEKLIHAWKESPMKNYTFQNIYTDKNCSINHTKIRKNGTKMYSSKYESKLNSQGIWIDIFVLEKVPNNFLIKFYIYFWAYVRLVFSRANALLEEDNKINIMLLKRILCIIPQKIRNYIVMYADKKIGKYKEINKNFFLVDLSTPTCFNVKFDSLILNDYIKIFFEGEKFPIFKDFDLFLKTQYNEYMKLPPENERVCKHNPKILEFD